MNVRLATEFLIDGVPLARVFIAGNLLEARLAEQALSWAQVRFVLAAERFVFHQPFFRGFNYWGLAFYVPTAEQHRSQESLETAGLGSWMESEWGEVP